ncbi:MAG: hypothetical protein A2504_14235 [Bdellovibrionales bacterium RIFOXYD12_FULL_39_22]|nr:MAG: hypothetical protein A2385_04670 [Bdellovibrionales bacterium RIFOXYB1_FULL_39_21]OFZ43441.1 MAG: hypothetical protein A2485_13185 [Bdellovibrionales bacterium RIFOXYC12_FULL_39_17]OFZ46984.1 MAG: hypothetical protein A2404_00245 [Bdellovibrionales bacterium RIFOXYC1_FULL_39_130]OFZ72958.1 MAG: hypothetical protein A2451_07315 [Bdellovibrionales bacterium RIFOXYC2_FULL_39_8]OFZ76181.1 MAG: hypothetical protein A2560_07495 [Bdellovibrionales bacterium RIFOXYD1_FULL_39_84]OFZ94416.1 MAG:
MKSQFVLSLALLLLTFIVTSCAKEEFGANKIVDSQTSPGLWAKTTNDCANFTLIRPRVDFLFLWDNSSSQLFVTDATKKALNNTIDLVATRFDYRIVLAPLNGTGPTDTYIVTENPDGLTASALSRVIPRDQAGSKLSNFPISGGSDEHGLERTVELVTDSYHNGIFRQSSYLITVLMSNEDDVITDGAGYFSGPLTDLHISEQKAQLLSLRNSLLHSQQFRFISLVSHQNCSTGFKANYSYKKMSKLIYDEPYLNGIVSPADQNSRATPDSYDICGANFNNLFDGINESIQDTVIKHVYNFWPISSATDPSFDPEQVTVRKSTGVEIPRSDSDGFTILPGIQYNHNTRLHPNPGEPFTGHLLELHGQENYVQYPECLIVKTKEPLSYYGHVLLSARPQEDSIALKINGKDIPRSTTNGWEYIGYRQSQNIKVISPDNEAPKLPGIIKTGYFLKLHGSAIYSNGSVVSLTYYPAAAE